MTDTHDRDHCTVAELGDLMDGVATSGRAAEHLRLCAECRRRSAALERLLRDARRLDRELAPPPMAWEGIRRAIEEGKEVPLRQPAPVWTRQAAGIAASLLLVGGGVLAGRALSARGDGGLFVAGPAASPSTAPIAAIDRTYLPTIETLAVSASSSSKVLLSASGFSVDRSLSAIDRAIIELRAALEQDPDNAALADMLGATYRQKVELLRRVSELAPTIQNGLH